MVKKMIFVVIMLFAITLCNNECAAFDLGTEIKEPSKSGNIPVDAGMIDAAKDGWLILRTAMQIAAFTFLIAMGVRYMLASADQRADIKGSLIVAIIGVVLVFGTTLVIRFVQNVMLEIF